MTTAPIQMPASIDFDDLYKYADAKLADPRQFDEVYFMGDHTETFAWRALPIAKELPNFAGIAVFSVSAGKRTRLSQQLPLTTNWRFVEMDELVARAASKKILIVDFNEYLAGKNIGLKLAEQGITVKDCLFALHQLGLKHTYETVKEERDYVIANLGRLSALAERFNDEQSRRTLYARMLTLLALERRPLLEVSYPLGVFINNFSTESGLVVGSDDVYIDVGAAHGDTVSMFFQLTRGKYRAMHAFEPDRANYFALENLSKYLPNVTPYFAGLGEEAGEIDFFEHPANRFGSNFSIQTGAHVKTTTKILRLDDVVDEATLIKVDVEGFESKVLKGGAKVIANHKPDMTISAYHYSKDIIEIYETVADIAAYKNVALRHYAPNLFDTQLVFSDRQKFD